MSNADPSEDLLEPGVTSERIYFVRESGGQIQPPVVMGRPDQPLTSLASWATVPPSANSGLPSSSTISRDAACTTVIRRVK